MMFMIMEVLTIILGVSTTILSALLTYRFWRIEHDLSKALAMMLGAEFVAGFITVIFAFMQFAANVGLNNINAWPYLDPTSATMLRWILFLTVGMTSIHLFIKLEAITK